MNENAELEELFGKSEDSNPQTPEVVPVEEELDIPKVHIDVDLKYEKAEHKGDIEDYSDDIQYVRNILLKNLASADKILESLMKKITVNDELDSLNDTNGGRYQAKYYEISTLLIKSICDAGKELINLHSTNLKIKSDNGEKKENDTNGNNLNVVELIRQIKSDK